MTIEVTSGVMARLVHEAHAADLHECCGLLLGQKSGRGERIDTAVAAANVSSRPEVQFEIDPQALFTAHKVARSGGPHVLGYYHSHPSGHPIPSATDCEHSTGDLRIWAIVASGEVAFYRDCGNGFTPLSCRIVES